VAASAPFPGTEPFLLGASRQYDTLAEEATVRRAAVLPVLALLLAAAPAARAAGIHYLVVRGSGAAVVDVTFAHPFRLLLDGTAPVPRVTTRGTYAGVWVENLRAGNLGAGVAVVPAMRGLGGDVPMTWGYTDSRLPAGHYRVHLLTDGPSEVRVAATGLGRDVALRSAGRDRVRAKVLDIEVAPGVGKADVGVTVYATTMTVLAASTDEDSAAATSSVCLTRQPSLPCGTSGEAGMSMVGGGVATESSTVAQVNVYPGEATADEYHAVYSADTPRARHLYAFALSVTA
jgi:hypothetical protein